MTTDAQRHYTPSFQDVQDNIWALSCWNMTLENESCSAVSNSLQPHELYNPWNSPGQNLEWVAFPFSRDLSNPGIKRRSPTLQAYSLPGEPQEKPKNTEVGSLSLLQQIFPTQESNQGLLNYRWILYQLSYEGSPNMTLKVTFFFKLFILYWSTVN